MLIGGPLRLPIQVFDGGENTSDRDCVLLSGTSRSGLISENCLKLRGCLAHFGKLYFVRACCDWLRTTQSRSGRSLTTSLLMYLPQKYYKITRLSRCTNSTRCS